MNKRSNKFSWTTDFTSVSGLYCQAVSPYWESSQRNIRSLESRAVFITTILVTVATEEFWAGDVQTQNRQFLPLWKEFPTCGWQISGNPQSSPKVYGQENQEISTYHQKASDHSVGMAWKYLEVWKLKKPNTAIYCCKEIPGVSGVMHWGAPGSAWTGFLCGFPTGNSLFLINWSYSFF